MRYPWKCPKCNAPANGHGEGGRDECQARPYGGPCGGFLCECDDDGTDGHGESLAHQCTDAHCYHCGWQGTYPKPPNGLQAWEKKALAEGWTMPAKREEELSSRAKP